MSKIQLSRYEQNIELPGFGPKGQAKLHAARVLIVGTGGLGCPAALYLTAAGIGHIGLVDADRVEISNLQRQILFGNEDVGALKVDAAKARLDKLAHHQVIKAYSFFLNSENALELINQYDVVIDATDNHIARLTINRVCLELKKPWIYAALFHYEGQIMVFDPRKGGPCFRCVFTDVDENSELPTCKLNGVLATVPGIMGCMQATEVQKLILDLPGASSVTASLHLLNFLTYNFSALNITRNHDCTECGHTALP